MTVPEIMQVARLIAAYLCDNLSKREREELNSWLKESPMHVALFKKLVCNKGRKGMVQERERVDVEMALKRVLLRRQRDIRVKRVIKWGIGLAACCLLAVFIPWNSLPDREMSPVPSVKNSDIMLVLATGDSISLSNQEEYLAAESSFDVSKDSLVYKQAFAIKEEYHELIIPKKKMFTLSLEDGTVITLNADSRLRYSTSLERKREVFLDGEAYFQVAKSEGKPFWVYTPNQVIRVYGTEFNVNTRGERAEETVLVKGSVSVASRTDSVEYYLEPNQMANYDLTTGNITVENVCPDSFVAWRDGFLVFDDATLDYLLCQLSRWYDFTIEYQDETLKQARVSCYISKNRDIADFLDALEKVIDVDFELIEGTLIVK